MKMKKEKRGHKLWKRFLAGVIEFFSGGRIDAEYILYGPCPRRDYYLFGNYKPKKTVPKRLKGLARENAEFKLRMQAYKNACKKFKETGERPDEEPLTIRTFFYELSNRLHYANNHIGGWEFFSTYGAILVYIALIFLFVNLIFKIILKLV